MERSMTGLFFFVSFVFLHSIVWGRPPTIGEFLTDMPALSQQKPSAMGGDNGAIFGPYGVQNFSYEWTGGLDDLIPQTEFYYSKQDGSELSITIQTLRNRVLNLKEGEGGDWSIPDFIKNLTVYQLFLGLEMLDDPLDVSFQGVWIEGRDDGPYNQFPSRFMGRTVFLLPNPFYDPKVPLSLSGQFIGRPGSVLPEKCILALVIGYYILTPLILFMHTL